jgi:hypothetical protein
LRVRAARWARRRAAWVTGSIVEAMSKGAGVLLVAEDDEVRVEAVG